MITGLGISGGIYGNPTGENIQPFSRSVTSLSNASETITYTGLVDDLVQATAFSNNHIRSRLGSSWLWMGIRADHQDHQAVSHHPQEKFGYAMADGSVKQMTPIQSLIKTDGSIATITNVGGSQWDATK